MSSEQRITAIEPQEKRENRRSIFLNGKFALGVDERIVADLGLYVGQQISEEELQKIVHAELATKAKDRALHLLEYRKRSRAELAQRLTRAGFAEDVVEETLAHLDRLGFIDDADFSESWVAHRLSGKAMGKARIKWELRRKGVASDVVEEALSAVNTEEEFATALEAARRRLQKDTDPDQRAKRRRLVSFLKRQGFDWETTNRVLNELSEESQED